MSYLAWTMGLIRPSLVEVCDRLRRLPAGALNCLVIWRSWFSHHLPDGFPVFAPVLSPGEESSGFDGNEGGD